MPIICRETCTNIETISRRELVVLIYSLPGGGTGYLTNVGVQGLHRGYQTLTLNTLGRTMLSVIESCLGKEFDVCKNLRFLIIGSIV